MKKFCILAVIMMMMTFVTAVQAEVRAGALPELKIDNNIKDCSCPPCCQESVKPAPMKEKVILTLNIEFDTDKAVIKQKYYSDVKKVSDFMKEYPGTAAAIEGHTDNVGDDAYNKTLSEKRANSVRQYIIDKFGIDGSRLTAAGYGEERPIAGNDTAEGRQKNRRVEAVIEAIKIIK